MCMQSKTHLKVELQWPKGNLLSNKRVKFKGIKIWEMLSMTLQRATTKVKVQETDKTLVWILLMTTGHGFEKKTKSNFYRSVLLAVECYTFPISKII